MNDISQDCNFLLVFVQTHSHVRSGGCSLHAALDEPHLLLAAGSSLTNRHTHTRTHREGASDEKGGGKLLGRKQLEKNKDEVTTWFSLSKPEKTRGLADTRKQGVGLFHWHRQR